MDYYVLFFSYSFTVHNIGPQHPSTHGVPRCISILHGEIIQYIITEIGLLHRGTEKLIPCSSPFYSLFN